MFAIITLLATFRSRLITESTIRHSAFEIVRSIEVLYEALPDLVPKGAKRLLLFATLSESTKTPSPCREGGLRVRV